MTRVGRRLRAGHGRAGVDAGSRPPRGIRVGPGDSADAARVAETVQRLAVLLEAGVAPDRAWEHLAAAGDADAVRVAAARDEGDAVATALDGLDGSWRQVAVAWRVAQTVGAPLAPSLRGITDALRASHEARDDVAVTLAEPVATARLIAWLPLVAVALGVLFGFDIAATLTRPLGVACLVAGVALMLIARRWTARLVRAAQPEPGIPGLQCEVVAIALRGGVSLDRALHVVEAGGGGVVEAETDDILRLSRLAGAPAVDLLRAAAAAARHRTRTEARLRAARLGSRLLVPLGVCTLPSFMLLGVGPMLLSVLSGEIAIL